MLPPGSKMTRVEAAQADIVEKKSDEQGNN